MKKITLENVNAAIVAIGGHETSFKAAMGEASRDFLTYVAETGDIDAVNRLMAVLTPINRDKARSYFIHFLPYNWDAKAARFSGKSKNKDVVSKKDKLVAAFLADEAESLWTWYADQQGPAIAKAKEYEKKIEALVKKAIEDKNEGISAVAVIRAVIRGGASLAEIMEAIAPAEQAKVEVPVADKKAA